MTLIETGARPGQPAGPDPGEPPARWLSALREAVVAMSAALATLVSTRLLAVGPGPTVLAVVLCLALSRSGLDRSLRGRAEAALVLPIVALLAAGVAWLLQTQPWTGALVFVSGLFVSIWLRRFGPMARRAGSLIALPFVVLLTTPYQPPHPGGRVPPALVPVAVALLALFWVSTLQALAQRWRFLAPVRPVADGGANPATTGPTMRPVASTRMAIQMAVALAVAFMLGYTCFADHWTWLVLTTFIVLSGNRGRLDVAYKSLLRVLGAAAGTWLALAVAGGGSAHDTATAALILLAVFLAVWLRPLGYGWWAMFVTLALALLQHWSGQPVQQVMGPRLGEIVIGAAIGVTTAWCVLPVRSSAVLRRRLADALARLSEALDPDTPERGRESFDAALAAVEQVAPAFMASRALARRWHAEHPADWVDVLRACREPALALIDAQATPVAARRAVGDARQALREPATLLPALQTLRMALVASAGDDSRAGCEPAVVR